MTAHFKITFWEHSNLTFWDNLKKTLTYSYFRMGG